MSTVDLAHETAEEIPALLCREILAIKQQHYFSYKTLDAILGKLKYILSKI